MAKGTDRGKSEMKDFLEFLPSDIEKIPLPGDGGHRVYTRLKTAEKNYMLVSCGTTDKSFKDFIRIQKLLEKIQVKVPKIYKTDFQKGLLLLEDLGNVTLQNIVEKEGMNKAEPFYFKALKELIRFQTDLNLKTPQFERSFFLKETKTALDHIESFLNIKGKNSLKEFHQGFLQDMEKVVSQLETTPFVFCHRDFHSRNLMITQGEIRTIDFQDGGFGPFCYDLTSLFYDSYVLLNPASQRKFLSFYWDKLEGSLKRAIGSLQRAELLIQLQFLQRGWKAAGCFAGFYTNGGKSTHLKYIPGTLQRLEDVAHSLSYSNIEAFIKSFRQEVPSLSYTHPV